MTFLSIIIFLVTGYSLLQHQELFSFAWKNLYRNQRRTLITLTAVILATTANIFVETYFNNMFWGLRESTIRSELGHIQIQHKDFLEKGSGAPTRFTVRGSEAIVNFIRSDKELMAFINDITTEIIFSGIMMSADGENSVNYLGRGVESDKNYKFSSFDVFDEGVGLDSQNETGISIGSGLAVLLGIEIDDPVTLLSQMSGGGVNVLDGEVTGIFTPLSKEYSKVAVKSDIQFAKDLVGTDQVNKILILLNRTEDTDLVLNKIKTRILNNFGNELQVYHWMDLAEFYKGTVSLFNNFLVIFRVILAVIVFFLITNTMTMSIYERFQEIGTLRAIGFTKNKIVYLFLNEAFIIGVVGGVLGVLLALGVNQIVDQMEIMLEPPPGQAREVPLRLLFRGEYDMLFQAFCLSTSIAWISTLLPSIRAARLKIVDCLRHV